MTDKQWRSEELIVEVAFVGVGFLDSWYFLLSVLLYAWYNNNDLCKWIHTYVWATFGRVCSLGRPLPWWEAGASLTLLFSCRCSSWYRSRRESSQSYRRDLWSLSGSSGPVGSLRHLGSSLPQKMWSSDKEPAESVGVRKQTWCNEMV